MPVYSRKQLSGSTNGRALTISQTASPGDVIHTVQSTSTAVHECVWLWARNSNTTDVLLTLELISSTATLQMPIFLSDRTTPDQAFLAVFQGLPLTGTDTILRAFTATTANAVSMTGYVNRIAT